LERISKDKHSSLLGIVVSDKGKKFHNVGTRSDADRGLELEPDFPRQTFSSSAAEVIKVFRAVIFALA
jgi:hypothetical protein